MNSPVPNFSFTNPSSKTVITFVLDETGSMEPLKRDTIGGFNNYINSLRSDAGAQYEFNLILFNSMRTVKRHVAAPLESVQPLTEQNYQPQGGTPLYDAIGKAIKATEEQVLKRTRSTDEKQKVIVVIQTDGEENASREYNLQSVKVLIETMQGQGWAFVFLGCNLDAYKAGGAMGIPSTHTVMYAATAGGTAATFDNIARSTRSYAASGLASNAAFTDDERKKAGDNTQVEPPKTN